jgi:predicted phosphoribosyltransferase
VKGVLLTSKPLTGRTHVFADRAAAGRALSSLLPHLHGTDALVLAIPSGGVPVAAALAADARLALDVAPVSKALFPWTTESGFGAVAFDGSSWIDEALVARHRLTDRQLEAALDEARQKVARRVARLRGARPFEVANRSVVLVDDGIAGGATMRTAITALRRAGVTSLVVAVPTAHEAAVAALEPLVDVLAIANLRGGRSFAVADAYAEWRDVDEAEAAGLLAASPGWKAA